jgi:DNA (cytosine-5)-methyltransferase 1
MKIGSLCSGYGGLDMAVEAFYGAETAWMSDIDKSSCLVIEKRWNLPNLGDLKKVDWSAVEAIDILTAGYPCQPFSNAGQRKGLNDPRHIWPDIKQIISKLRPSIVILENVRGHLSLGFKEVLQELTEVGYDAKWTIVRASDVGAPHRRERLFILAQPTDSHSIRSSLVGNESGAERNKRQSQSQSQHLGESTIAHPNSSSDKQLRRAHRTIYGEGEEFIDRPDREVVGSSGEAISNANSEQLSTNRQAQGLKWRFETPSKLSMRRTPNPLDQSKLNPIFVEYMMGLPEGWVTDLGLSRAQQFKLLGNGVVPQQAYEAIRRLNALST